MSATSASSLILPFLKPNTLSSSNPRSISLSLFSLSHKLNAKPLFCSAFQSFELLAKKSSFSSTFVRNVAVSSEYGQEEDLFDSDDGEVAPSFSADLKVFVGNLPFGVDSSQLADLFGSAGNVELVEVKSFILYYVYVFSKEFVWLVFFSLCFGIGCWMFEIYI